MQTSPTTKESIIILFYTINFAISPGWLSERLSSPSVRAMILFTTFGYFYYKVFNISTAFAIESYTLVKLCGVAKSTNYLNYKNNSVNSHYTLILLSKKINATTWWKLYAIVLSANAEKNALTAPIL